MNSVPPRRILSRITFLRRAPSIPTSAIFICNIFQYKNVHPCTALRICTGRKAHRASAGIALLFRDHGTRKGLGVNVTPRPLFTPGKTRYPSYRRLGGPQCRSGQVRKISPPPGFDPRTVQPVASRYTDYATRPTFFSIVPSKSRYSWSGQQIFSQVI